MQSGLQNKLISLASLQSVTLLNRTRISPNSCAALIKPIPTRRILSESARTGTLRIPALDMSR